MAYYSFDYKNIFRERNPKFLYFVSIQKDEKSGHKKDNTNNWGRAPSLSIIGNVDIQEVDNFVRNSLDEYKNNLKEKTQIAA